MELILPEDSKEMINQSKYKSALEQVLNFTFFLINENELKPTEIQRKILINHLSEMVERAEEKRDLAEVDKRIFDKVSGNSLEIAQSIVNYVEKNVGNLSDSEKYVLSIHFETMKLKEK